MNRQDVFNILRYAGINGQPDFFTLTSGQVEGLLDRAKVFKYRTPRNANGSRARCFYAYLIRIISRKEA